MGKCFSAGIVLAGGTGRRMKNDIPKQYMDLNGKPVFIHSLEAYEKSDIDDVILVISKEDREYCMDRLKDFGIKKVIAMVEGGSERYLSVYNALKHIFDMNYDIVSIHDSARPVINSEYINKSLNEARTFGSSVLAVKLKDTVKIAEDMFVEQTLDRNRLYSIQTPQTFDFNLLKTSYEKLMKTDISSRSDITDDAMVVERMSDVRVKLTEGFYENIKITTPEDMLIASIWKK